MPKTSKKTKKSKQQPEGKIQVAAGFSPIPVFGLEQTEPAPNSHLEKVYCPLNGETGDALEVIDGYKVPWWPWFEEIRKDLFKSWDMTDCLPNVTLAATLGAAVIAKLRGEHTELADLLQKLKIYNPKEIAEYIDTAAKAVERYLSRKQPSTTEAESTVDRMT